MCFSSTAVHVLGNQAVFGTVSNSTAMKRCRGQKTVSSPSHSDSVYMISSLHDSSRGLKSAPCLCFQSAVFPSRLKSHGRWASLTSLPPSRSCPVLSNEQTLSVLKNGQGPEAMFRIQMFKFVGGSYTNVFLHCNVQICHSTAGQCQPVSEHAQPSFVKLVVRGLFRQVANYMCTLSP